MSAPVPLRLRPLEIGDILDEIFRMYRRHFLLLAGIAVVFSIPLAALAGYGFFALFSDALAQAATGATPDFNAFAPSLITLAIGSLVNFAITPLLYGALSAAICQSSIGQPVTWWGAIKAALRRYLHVAGLLIIFALMTIAFCLFPLWIWIAVGWVAVLPAMFVENIGLVAAMRRSWSLVQGRWWRTFFLLFLVFVLNYVVYLALGAFLYLGQTLLALFLSPYLAIALYEGGVVLASALTHPILQIAIVLIYFDLRVRKEALDLFQLSQRVTAAMPPAPA
jgi:Membrane domain of glycerophosphoryl diester phosphodiesterase